MSWWVLVRALPLLGGPVGAAVAVAALRSGGKQLSNADWEAAFRKYVYDWKAERAAKTPVQEKAEDLVRVQRAREVLKGHADFFDNLVNAFAIGIACANAKGFVTDEERRDIQEFIGGVASANFPPDVQARLHARLAAPLSFDAAFELCQAANERQRSLYRDVIEVALNAGDYHERKLLFSCLWEDVSMRTALEGAPA